METLTRNSDPIPNLILVFKSCRFTLFYTTCMRLAFTHRNLILLLNSACVNVNLWDSTVFYTWTKAFSIWFQFLSSWETDLILDLAVASNQPEPAANLIQTSLFSYRVLNMVLTCWGCRTTWTPPKVCRIMAQSPLKTAQKAIMLHTFGAKARVSSLARQASA